MACVYRVGQLVVYLYEKKQGENVKQNFFILGFVFRKIKFENLSIGCGILPCSHGYDKQILLFYV